MGSMRNQPAYGKRLPVVKVSWNECEEFVKRLNSDPALLADAEFNGYVFALPTEAQWEDSSREGFLCEGFIYVGEKSILEWCSDWSDAAKDHRVVRSSNDDRNARAPALGYDRVGFRLAIVPGKKDE
jgi:formylglycine-generating enzyme required for sulfatase activity